MSHGCYIVGYVYVNADFNVNCFEHEKEIIYLYPLTKFQAKHYNFLSLFFHQNIMHFTLMLHVNFRLFNKEMAIHTLSANIILWKRLTV